MPLSIRPASPADAAAFAHIYRHYVAETVITFELEPPDAAEMERRRADIAAKGLPWLTAEDETGAVVGYAYAGPFRGRPAWRWTIEDSIYLDHRRTGQGIGKALLSALIEECARRDFRQMMSMIGDSENAASVALHRGLGFTLTGVLPGCGWKFGRWVDCVLMQLSLGDGKSAPPKP